MEHLYVHRRRFVLTRAKESDVAALVDLLTDDELGVTRESAVVEPYLAAFREIDADPHHLLVAVRDDTGAVVGTMQLTLLRGLARGGATRLQIEAVRLASSTRGIGLGSALFEWAHEYGRRHGAVLAQLTSDKLRTDAHRFYRGLGYTASHEGFKRSLRDLDGAVGLPPTGAADA
jgi:GNAT superfamily N-acetyltransferase